MCSAVTSFWPCVRLFQVFGRVFGRFLVFGRVFGCYECLAVCSAVTIFGRVLSCYKRWPCVRPFQVLVGFGFVIFFMFLFVRFSTCFGLCPFIFSLAPSFFLVVPSILFRHVLSRTRIFSPSFYSSIFYYCSALFMYSLFLHILCVLILLCFGRDFCFLLFRSYSRGLFCLGARLFCFVIVVVSAFCSMLCGLVSHHLSLIRISVFARSYLAFLRTIDMRISLSSLCLVF